MADTDVVEDAVDEGEDGTKDSTQETPDESRKFFEDMTPEQRADIKEASELSAGYKATEVVAMAAETLDARKKAKEAKDTQEQEMWNQREDEKKTNDQGDDDDEPVTRGEMKQREKALRDDLETKSQAERDEGVHRQQLASLGVTEDLLAFNIRKSAEAYAAETKTDLASAYKAVSPSFKIESKKSATKDPVDRAIANTGVPAGSSGRGSGEDQAPPGPELCSEEHMDQMRKRYG